MNIEIIVTNITAAKEEPAINQIISASSALNCSIDFPAKSTPIELYDETIWHELSHDINKNIIKQSPKLKQDISNIFIKKEDLLDIEGVKKAREYVASRYPSRKKQIIDNINTKLILYIIILLS